MSAATALTPELAAKVERLDALLAQIGARHDKVKFASSLAAEDMVLTHAILSKQVPIGIFSLNTGRLHAETLGMIDRVRERYGYEIEQFHPEPGGGRSVRREHGANAFYDSVELRKSCCHIRKVEPLNRALADVGAWVTGQRREQSVTRAELHEEERTNRAASRSSIRSPTGPKPTCGRT
jgi:phosphoadenosine phosphosulfate reductase